MFEIERRCMDRDSLVIHHLNKDLPGGLALDMGTGNGFTAVRLSFSTRTVVALEPDRAMPDHRAPDLTWLDRIQRLC
jgi:predicted RNA methylase